MSEETTQNLPDGDQRSFEERVFARLDAIDSRFDTIDSRFDAVDSTLRDFDARLQKLEARPYDTKPIWEQALKEIMETRAQVVKVEDRLGNIENEIKDMRRVFRYTFADVTRVQADIEERLDKIEGHERAQ